MTTKRTYECNLCRISIRDVGEGSGWNKEGIGVYFVSQGEAERRSCMGADNHICLSCLAALRAIPQPEKP